MLKARPDYQSFLLRLYRVRGEPGAQSTPTETIWRASLENPRTHQRQGFADLEELFDFLRHEIGVASNSAGEPLESPEKTAPNVFSE